MIMSPSRMLLETVVCDAEQTYHTAEQIFNDVLFMMIFFAALWLVGKISVRLAMPALVGEIIIGIILGPNLLDIVPKWDALVVLGDIGLLLLVLEAGIDVNMGVLKVVGTKGLMVAVFGSMFPLAIGSVIALFIWDFSIEPRTAVAIGACFAPTSMGIALEVLRNGGVLNTPTGQLIIAAAVLDDVIALMLLSILQELGGSNPSMFDIVWVLCISPILILVFGFISIRVSPKIIKYVMDRIDIAFHEYAILLMLFSSMLVLVPICFYVKSSYLLGAFLAGIMLCTDHTIHHAWDKQMKRIMLWMLRIFFACTIGFAVPIQDFMSDRKIVLDACLYFIAVIGKLATGIFATSRPIQLTEFCMISFSMAAWGEFAFILATQAYGGKIITKNTMTSILMAVLFSVIIAPLLLRADLQIIKKQKHLYMQQSRKTTVKSLQSFILSQKPSIKISDFDDNYNITPTPIDNNPNRSYSAIQFHFVYYCIHTKTYGKWGHQNRLLKSLYSLKLEIIDFRSFNEPQDNFSHIIVQNIFYVKDTKLSLIPSKQLAITSKRKLSKRVKYILNMLHIALQDKEANIIIKRWLPGIKQKDDCFHALSRFDQSDNKTKKKAKKKLPSVKYIRNEAYKQARFALSFAKLPVIRGSNAETDKNEMKIDENKSTNMNEHSAIGGLSRSRYGLEKQYEDNVHNAESDILTEDMVKLRFDDDHEDTISLEIMYGDEYQAVTPSVELSGNNPLKVMQSILGVSNPSTPLLKEKEKEAGRHKTSLSVND